MFEFGKKSVPKVELSEYRDPIGMESNDVERSLVARLTTIGQEASWRETAQNLHALHKEVVAAFQLSEADRGPDGLKKDALSRLKEDVSKKGSELFHARLSENSMPESMEEMIELHDLAVLGNEDDTKTWKEIFEPMAFDFFENRVKVAEDLHVLYKEAGLIHKIFTEGENRSKILKLVDERAVELFMKRIGGVENAAGCRGLESLVDAFPFKDSLLKDQMLDRIRERLVEIGS